MKRFLLLIATLASLSTYAQWRTVTGNGNLQKETREVGSFSGISVSGSMNVQMKYGQPGSLTIEADENLLQEIETVVEKGVLYIRPKKKVNLKSKNKIVVQASATQLNTVGLSGSGNISGSGNFEATGENRVAISGSGNINLDYASLGNVTLAISGSGNMTLKARSAKSINAALSGSGNIDVRDIPTDNADVSISGSGNVRVYANNSLDAKVSGSGNVYYKGNAAKVNSRAVGSGKVIKI